MPVTQLEQELQALVDVAPDKRAKDEPTIHVTCFWCKTVFNQDPEVDERNFLKLHQGVCERKTEADRAFYREHRRWPPPRRCRGCRGLMTDPPWFLGDKVEAPWHFDCFQEAARGEPE
ncbi:MAG TPA: hypothetical protein VET26_00760 [Candidatus Sulfotelmatobacter sp.]|nr:hypothetical protein [Candidatus Sulfotelmatobacter sp.]